MVLSRSERSGKACARVCGVLARRQSGSVMLTTHELSSRAPTKHDADYVFYELTRSICPECRRVIDAQILLRDNKVYMRKRCPEHGMFEALVYGDAQAYTANSKFNKPGTIPLQYTTPVEHGC